MGQPIYYNSAYTYADLKNACRRYLQYYPFNTMTDDEFIAIVNNSLSKMAERLIDYGFSDYLVVFDNVEFYDKDNISPFVKVTDNWIINNKITLLTSNSIHSLEKSYVLQYEVGTSIIYPTRFVISAVSNEVFSDVLSQNEFVEHTGMIAISDSTSVRVALCFDRPDEIISVNGSVLLHRNCYKWSTMDSKLDIKDERFHLLLSSVINDLCDIYNIKIPKSVYNMLKEWSI